MLRLFRSMSRGRRKKDNDDTRSTFTQSPERSRHRRVARNIERYHDDEDEFSPRHPANGGHDYFGNVDDDGIEDDEELDDEIAEDEDQDAIDTPLLPIFSAAHLDRIPLYNVTHAIRQLIVQKCETTLSWDQLRSPQISQFLVKPVQGQIRADHFNRATICALIANCLQFQKEGQMNPGNVGVSRTRALISELLAIRLLKEYTTRELIDSLSYDFDPLSGMDVTANMNGRPSLNAEILARRAANRVARVSTIEIAIRAEAKRFLAHPLVVQHLEAIWAGNIVFHSEADNLHRKHRQSELALLRGRQNGYGTNADHETSELPADAVLSKKAQGNRRIKRPVDPPLARRTVTLYDPRDASLFKLSRLRVPRYRQVFSTLSFATMLALFVAVLAGRSLPITPLEVIFWFWSVGYMLDEVVGFTEQGFGLYILSFWNAFDLGILFLFLVYYCLRLYGIVLADDNRQKIAGIAYDVLASTAILLFPRLFSVLDHYRYFSQLLIAFRLMALDLVAVLVLIVICCSGFFVALSLSFADTRDANGVAYSLFQILMGFTPAVWDHWNGYNILGKVIMASFLTLCHFLIVTILITVLTNSFMAIVRNAEEEHQFLFAVNTISMVKSDALFSYVAPTNIVGWLLSPIRFIVPLRQYVKFNRTIIKVSHAPILFVIFSYERTVMARSAYAPVEQVERQHIHQKQPVAFTLNKAPEMYTPSHRLREPSVISFNKDRALDEVFRRPFRGDTVRTTTREMDPERRHSTNAVDQWMQVADLEGGASPPLEQPRSVLERLEHGRPKFKRAMTSGHKRMLKQSRDFSTATRSIASDPDGLSLAASKRPQRIVEESEPDMSNDTLPHDTEADGDDEINDDSDHADPLLGESALSLQERTPASADGSEYFQTPMGMTSPMMQLSHAAQARLQHSPEIMRSAGPPKRGQAVAAKTKGHGRQASSATILFDPQPTYDSSTSMALPMNRASTSKNNSGNAGTGTPRARTFLDGTRTPNRKQPVPAPRPRPNMPQRQKTAPNMQKTGLTFMDIPTGRRREPSFNARALDLASEIGDNKFGPSGGYDAGGISGMPASFSEQLMRERELQRRAEEDRRRSEEEETGMVNRIMLARMHTLEEGFREVLKEIKDMSHNANSGSRRDSEGDSVGQMIRGGPKAIRPRVDTQGSTTGGSGWQTPKTPIGRIGGNEKSKAQKSPRKVVRRNSKKGKENDRPSSSEKAGRPSSGDGPSKVTRSEDFEFESRQALHQLAREQHLEEIEQEPSPDSIKSVVEISQEQSEQAATRPSTAIRGDEGHERRRDE
ncbi:Calcium channel [Fulvia fulva]|uniref:Calcium channel n=1 Tax=Passalora fulva TaxID=5499 RepID=A0A9Q8PDM8_PASFU|nr:Calcium channel [Fulvia fulva]KAK4617602.1 Calcium channel [Fulvia fulva]KAK4619219.1 Calcium channel [Fulvia fulva]UJO20553.1 Calcium channel [Fulvia fulva]WPV18068.1 Calcium channel [Fulvia fulva]WPV33023.1 Calcium channel [Fulvia fulva]